MAGHYEIERRFLLNKQPKFNDLGPTIEININQSYLVTPIGYCRLREIIHPGNNSREYWGGYKSGVGLKRKEIEHKIDKKTYNLLYNLSKNVQINKTRVTCLGNPHWEIDIFRKKYKGLVIAELEFKSEKEAIDFKIPSNISNLIDMEITGNALYSNYYLALYNDNFENIPDAIINKLKV